jgi:hypothetical protein
MDRIKNYLSDNSSIVVRVFVGVVIIFTEPLPSNDSVISTNDRENTYTY